MTLTGTPAAGTKAVSWSGCNSVNGENKCLVTMTAAKEVTATFDLEPTPKFKLTVKETGTGSGTVTSSPTGINCSSGTCSTEFEEGTTVTLTGTPAAGTKAVSWSGCNSVNGENKCLVTMTAAKEVTATFDLEPTPKFKLTVKEVGIGSGTVTSSPTGINCSSGTCSTEFEEGTTVTLTGTPAAGTKAVSWSGCNSVNGENKCLVTMTAAKEVTATFDLEQRQLSVTPEGTGSGTVTSSPAGISCGSECSANFDDGTTVTLTGTPGAETNPVQWAGCDSVNGENKCLVTMTAAKSVTATFEAEETGPLTPTHLTVAKTGEGTVVSSPGGIECSPTCQADFELNETVTLIASPAAGWAFYAWGGCAEHTGLTCKVTMSAAKTVKATFTPTPSLTVEKAGSGSGKVTATGISCDASCSKATAAIKAGTSVTVKVVSSKGSEAAVFENGTGSATGCSGASCIFTISANSSVKVKFDPTPTKTLTVKLTGPAAYKGKVKGKAFVKGLVSAGISCGSGCTTATESFFATDTIELSALAAIGYTFEGWTVKGGSAGTCAGKALTCTLPTDADKTVEAEFK